MNLSALTDDELMQQMIALAADDGEHTIDQMIEGLFQAAIEWERRELPVKWKGRAEAANQGLMLIQSMRTCMAQGKADRAIEYAMHASRIFSESGLLERVRKFGPKCGPRNRKPSDFTAAIKSIRQALEEVEPYSFNRALAEFHADYNGKEGLLEGLRESGEISLRVTCLDEDRIVFQDTTSGKVEEIQLESLQTKFSKVK